MEHVATFVVHISRTFAICSICADDRTIICDVFPAADDIIRAFLFAPVKLDKEILRVVGETLMYPHICSIFHGYVIAEPLMSGFMDDDEIELVANSGETYIAIAVPVAEIIAISN